MRCMGRGRWLLRSMCGCALGWISIPGWLACRGRSALGCWGLMGSGISAGGLGSRLSGLRRRRCGWRWRCWFPVVCWCGLPTRSRLFFECRWRLWERFVQNKPGRVRARGAGREPGTVNPALVLALKPEPGREPGMGQKAEPGTHQRSEKTQVITTLITIISPIYQGAVMMGMAVLPSLKFQRRRCSGFHTSTRSMGRAMTR